MNATAESSTGDYDSSTHRLLDFVASLIIDLARTHPRITQSQISCWLAQVAVGRRK
jgi:hypothetical protein